MLYYIDVFKYFWSTKQRTIQTCIIFILWGWILWNLERKQYTALNENFESNLEDAYTNSKDKITEILGKNISKLLVQLFHKTKENLSFSLYKFLKNKLLILN